jgi:hypothetical protein
MKNFNKELAIGLNAFIRDENLKRLIASCQTFYPELKIYIVEQGRISEKKRVFYDYLENEGHEIKQIPFDCGISYAREELRKFVKEPYLIYLQEDFIVVNETKFYNMLHILKSDPTLGVVCGGLISCRKGIDNVPTEPIIHGHFINQCDKALLYIPIDYLYKLGLWNWKKTKCKGLRYTYCDISWDFSLWNLNAQENLFDEQVHVIEHSHVYLHIKREHKWKVAYTPESVIIHTHDRSDKEYENFRRRRNDIKYLLNYWNISEMVNMGERKLLPNITKLTEIDNVLPEHAPEEPADNDNKIANPSIVHSSLTKILKEFDAIIKGFGKSCYLRDQTCWESVVKHTIVSSPLYITIPKLTESEIKYLTDNNFIYSNEKNMFSKNDCFIIPHHKLPEKSKTVEINNYKFSVPLPVHKYLENLYGTNWRTKDAK